MNSFDEPLIKGRKLCDRHNTKSLFGLKSDDVLYCGGDDDAHVVLNELYILCLGDIKKPRITDDKYTPEEYLQLVNYLILLLRKQARRIFAYGYLTDFRTISFVRVDAAKNGRFLFRKDPRVSLVHTGWKKLFSLYSLSMENLGFYLPLVLIRGIQCKLLEFLGSGLIILFCEANCRRNCECFCCLEAGRKEKVCLQSLH